MLRKTEAFSLSSESLSQIFDSFPDGIIVIDRDFKVLVWNHRLIYWSKIEAQDIIQSNLLDHFPHLNKPQIIKRIQGIFQSGPPVILSSQIHQYFIPCKLGDGNRIQHTIITPLKLKEYDHPLAMITIQEVTEITGHINKVKNLNEELKREIEARNLYETQLKEEADYLNFLYKMSSVSNEYIDLDKALSESLSVAGNLIDWPIGHIFLMDESRSYLQSSRIWHLPESLPQGFEHFKETTENSRFHTGVDLPGKVWEAQASKWIEDVLDVKGFFRFETNGSFNVRAAIGVPILVGERVRGVYEFFSMESQKAQPKIIDLLEIAGQQIGRILERSDHQKKLIEERDRADKESHHKSEFLSRMSHEFRTPMNAILGFTQLMVRDKKATLSDKHKMYLNKVLSAGKHLLQLINDILDLSGIESGNITLEIEKVDLPFLVREVIDIIQPLADKKQVSLETEFYTDQNIRVVADKLRLREILLNLVSNGIKYNVPKGRVTVSVLRGSKKGVLVKVRDTGMGISKEKQVSLFQPFDRLGLETSEIEGSGIGLTITRQLVAAMQGHLEFTSLEGQGSCFFFELPGDNFLENLPESTRPRENEISENSKSYPSILENKRILYIEDNQSNIDLLDGILKTYFPNFELRVVKTGREGVNLVKGWKPDLILLDLSLPGKTNGFQAFEELKQTTDESIPIVALTADAKDRSQKKARLMGFDGYLKKPFDPDIFYKLTKEILLRMP